MEAFRYSPFKAVTTGHRPIYDTVAALIAHGLFDRFDNLRIATIESGSDWVGELVPRLAKSYAQMPGAWGADPVETLRGHVWVSPYYEDDIASLARHVGVDHVLMGSDWPHAEGLAEPASFIEDLTGFSDGEIRKVMRDNGMALSVPRPR
jgi:predicted TIM-barrel fold metal-dependent hydrolase